MKFRRFPYDHVCSFNNLKTAWIECQPSLIASGVSHEAISDYECELHENLYDLAERLSDGRFLKTRPAWHADDERLALEDIIVQRVVFNTVEQYVDPQFLDCNLGFRSTRNRRMTVGRLLCYRESGDQFVVESEIADCLDSLDHDLLMLLIGNRVEDERLLSLIWVFLEEGRITGNEDVARHPAGLLNGQAGDSVEIAIKRLLSNGGFDELRDADGGWADRAQLKAILKRLLREAGKFALASSLALIVSKMVEKRLNKTISPKTILLVATAALAASNLPEAARFIREKFPQIVPDAEVETSMINPLAGLLVNVALHEFDLAMEEAGIHLVRYGTHFVITARDGHSARAALNLAARELSGLNLRLNPSKTRIASFDQEDVELFGYRYHKVKIAAEPVIRPKNWLGELRDEYKYTVGSVIPSTSRFRKAVREQINTGIKYVGTLFRRSSVVS
ncbi:MAG: hypothetical protein AB7U82_35850 [Blastocatellales bacterium]